MTKSEHKEVVSRNDGILLRTCAFFHTAESAKVPRSALELLSSLLRALKDNWTQNREAFQNRLIQLRSEVLSSCGTDPKLISLLIEDAQRLDDIKANHRKQIEILQSFQSRYTSNSWRITHEQPFDEVEKSVSKIRNEMQNFSRTTQDELDGLSDTSRNIIQLEFNLTSINEAQKSTSTNRSMKRLSWITFIFLPLLFVSSLFGMNVDLLKYNPAWWWYIPLAFGTLFCTLTVWLLFKRSNTLEDKLERGFSQLEDKLKIGLSQLEDKLKRGFSQLEDKLGRAFDWLLNRRQHEDLVQGSDLDANSWIVSTAEFSASGKKRS